MAVSKVITHVLRYVFGCQDHADIEESFPVNKNWNVSHRHLQAIRVDEILIMFYRWEAENIMSSIFKKEV